MIVSIIIPAFNEEQTISRIVDSIIKSDLPEGLKKEIIIINDGSDDNTDRILTKIAQSQEIIYINHKKNLGKGAAVRAGLKLAHGDIFLIQDADLEYDPKYYCSLLNPIINKQAEVVYGTRLRTMKLVLFGKNATPLPLHYIANKMLSFLTRFLFACNITDMETGFKVFTRKIYQSIQPLTANRFDFEPEITAKILSCGFKIYEIDIQTKPRSYCEGKKIQWYDAIFALLTLFKYRLARI